MPRPRRKSIRDGNCINGAKKRLAKMHFRDHTASPWIATLSLLCTHRRSRPQTVTRLPFGMRHVITISCTITTNLLLFNYQSVKKIPRADERATINLACTQPYQHHALYYHLLKNHLHCLFTKRKLGLGAFSFIHFVLYHYSLLFLFLTSMEEMYARYIK